MASCSSLGFCNWATTMTPRIASGVIQRIRRRIDSAKQTLEIAQTRRNWKRIVESGEHVVEPRQGPEVESRVVVQRRVVPQPPVGGIRVAVELVVERIELHRDLPRVSDPWLQTPLRTRRSCRGRPLNRAKCRPTREGPNAREPGP